MSPRPHIFLATPCFGGMVSTGYMQSVLGLVQAAGVAGFDLSLALLGHDALITRCRNTLLGAFMDGVASHLLFVDSDIAFTARTGGAAAAAPARTSSPGCTRSRS